LAAKAKNIRSESSRKIGSEAQANDSNGRQPDGTSKAQARECRTGEPEDWSKAQAGDWLEGSRKEASETQVKDPLDGGAGDAATRSRKLGPQAGPEGRSAAQAEDQPEGSAEGIEPTKNRRSSSKAALTGKSKTQVGDWPDSRAGDATAGVGRVIRQAGPKGRSAARAEGKPDGSAEGVSG